MNKRKSLHLGSRTFLDAHEIVFLYSHGNYTKVHMPSGEVITVSTTLGIIGTRLPDEKFVRVHRSCIVNLDYMADLNTTNIVLSNSVKINISRRKRTEVKLKIKNAIKPKRRRTKASAKSKQIDSDLLINA